METVMDYFLDELISDVSENPELYRDAKLMDILKDVRDFYNGSGYFTIMDVEGMSGSERREWMRDCISTLK